MARAKRWGGEKWQTWINHGLIAAAVAYMFSFWLGPAEAARLAVWGYLFRELGQQFHRVTTKREIFVLDSIMDVVVPVATAGAVWWWLT